MWFTLTILLAYKFILLTRLESWHGSDLQEKDLTIKHKPGKAHSNADVLSKNRNPNGVVAEVQSKENRVT